MPNRARRHVWSHRGALVAGTALLLIGRARAAPPGQVESPPTVADPGGLLTAKQRATLLRSLTAKAAESGSPLSILLVSRLGRHQTIAELARRKFSADGMDAPGPSRVLLAVASHERRAAIETGQGEAGIVPEIDARRIVTRLEGDLARRPLTDALDRAAAAIADSARATAERRRPEPPGPEEPGPPATQAAPPPPSPREAPTRTDGAPGAEAPAAGAHSLMPAAYAVAAFVVLGLALRRRRRNAEERVTRTAPPAPKSKPGSHAKSIGDRPMS